MAERIQRERTQQRPDEVVEPTRTRPTVDYDAILDQIESVLETDAEEYVRSFVQKGGQ